MKYAHEVKEWGRLKAFQNDTIKDLIGLDIETVDNELLIIGSYDDERKYQSTTNDFHNFFFDTLIYALQHKKHIATWSRFDNNILFRMLLDYADDINRVIERVNKYPAQYDKKKGYIVKPLISIKYKGFTINLDNMIRECLMFRIFDIEGNNKIIWSYNIKNLYEGYDIEEASKSANLSYYSKIGIDYHVIDKKRFNEDFDYKTTVLKSNELDARACRDLGLLIQQDYYDIFKSYPKSLISAGSLARSSVIDMSVLLGKDTTGLSFKSVFNLKDPLHKKILEYSMLAYHGGKIDSNYIGFIKNANIMDLTSAYPYAMKQLKSFKLMTIYTDLNRINDDDFSYMFVKCNLNIKVSSDVLSTPFIYVNPVFESNINPYGYIKDIVLTKYDFEFCLKHSDMIDMEIIDYIGIKTIDEKLIYNDIIDVLFKIRIELKNNKEVMKEALVKRIINSLYGITQELTDLFNEDIDFIGYRAGDYFNSVISSHITSFTRNQISEMNNKIINRGGKILLNMTDSILSTGCDTKDLCSDVKTLGTFEYGGEIENVMILGSGRYEYFHEGEWTIKTRGFTSPKKRDKSYYVDIIKNDGKIKKQSFVSIARSKTFSKTLNRAFSYQDIGLIYDDESNLNPFNLGGKRYIDKNDLDKDVTKELIKTHQIYLDKYL
jgi:hypothetical protein